MCTDWTVSHKRALATDSITSTFQNLSFGWKNVCIALFYDIHCSFYFFKFHRHDESNSNIFIAMTIMLPLISLCTLQGVITQMFTGSMSSLSEIYMYNAGMITTMFTGYISLVSLSVWGWCLLRQSGAHFTNNLWAFNQNLANILLILYIDCQCPIRPQICKCHDSWAVVTYAKLWPDWICILF